MRESSREKLERMRRKGLKETLVFGGKSSLRYVNMIFEAFFCISIRLWLYSRVSLGFHPNPNLMKGEFGGTINCKRPVL